VLLVTIAFMIVTSVLSASLASADYTPSYCVISDVHVSSLAPTGYSSTVVHVTITFSVYCTGGSPSTVWDIQTRVYAESNLIGVTAVSSSENQYSSEQGTARYVVNTQFDAMSYYGYGEQTPSFYVQITAINTSTGALDGQQQAPFAVDTSQYPFNLAQQNYCNFPGLSQFFKLLPGCGGSANSTVSTAPTSGNCNTFGLPQFLQPYLPGCGGTGSETVASNQSSSQQLPVQQPGSSLTPPSASSSPGPNTPTRDRSNEAILGIIVSALASCLVVVLVTRNPTRFRVFHSRAGLNSRGKFCPACGMRLQVTANFCGRCGEACPHDQENLTFRL
jgi:hypothetical protein